MARAQELVTRWMNEFRLIQGEMDVVAVVEDRRPGK